MTRSFYDELAPYYHLIYPDWEASIERQARSLAAVLEEFGVEPGTRVLDAACGIGTQSLGLARLGYDVTASDIAPEAVARAKREAATRSLPITFGVADLRELSATYREPFPAIIACDNSIPHLLSDAEIARAFAECRRCLSPSGVLVVSVRDYDQIARRTPDVHPYGRRTDGDIQYEAEQLWNWDGDQYDMTLRLIEQKGGVERVHEFCTRYYAVGLNTLQRLMTETGFARVVRRDEHFFQPLLVGITPPAS